MSHSSEERTQDDDVYTTGSEADIERKFEEALETEEYLFDDGGPIPADPDEVIEHLDSTEEDCDI